MTLPRKFSSLVARSRRGLKSIQLRRGVHQGGGGLACGEDRVVDDVLEEGNVGLETANPEFAQGPVHAVAAPGPRSCAEAMTFTSSES